MRLCGNSSGICCPGNLFCSNVTEKENDDYVPFLNWFFFVLTMTMILRLSV
jgi:hypothetical protein